MGRICKSPATRAERIQASTDILGFLLRADGLSATLRRLQYAIEAHTRELAAPGPIQDLKAAEACKKANELLDGPYETIKKELKL